MNEYPCTRNAPYRQNCPGRHDIGSRQGRYIREEASRRMALHSHLETN
ncbi:MAG: hypothetical protein N5P05_004678 (plasmid) [Chroococcopsis gigantea SAG 12.99]|nr:hypothetical protein [Chroococcopsis gigantea SAG 12.99]